ncbi:MAG: acyl-CoA dehydrogenase C-terminal domain-containing protein [Gammaproteobacteria bacterium]|nr:acyl-CoA dehydrogenase C-terminal domain-containing protein [Gammaproteobacteria bacterium]MBT8111673.1 acyl-CoA dehydrogenase C-terminal domain-containing protein [Gammaproteobacteria bacterium]NNL46371.1 acyl-CoA dehydrogenase [Woeseiaceae bacterium]
MTTYKAPLRDMRFVMQDLLNVERHYQSLPACEEVNQELIDAILEEASKFSEDVVAPLNAIGDEEGCRMLDDGGVRTPRGFKEAYRQYVDGGWPALDQPARYGGQDLPMSIGTPVREMNGTANWSWAMYPGLSHGAMETIEEHGSEKQKAIFMEPLVSGRWTGTMCLTEAHCGTDLGLLKCKAEQTADGTYRITGSKVFISSGDHDLAENIVHIVLARMPDSPPGTKGISLFIVPKFIPNEDGSIGERNTVSCGALERKMGIHGNSTCLLNFDGATGYLVGDENKGLSYMFTFMNFARLGTGLQGLAHSELAFQNSLAYTRDRLQMRSLSGAKNPGGPADPIIVHPDVRRMLLTQKAFAEGGRALLYFASTQGDILTKSDDPEARELANHVLNFLTPIIKAFLTETGLESANLGLQCFGGHGYVSEWGVEQNVRDARIGTLYEGTTGIQALDLLGRKVLGTRGKALAPVTGFILDFCKRSRSQKELRPYLKTLVRLTKQWKSLTRKIGFAAMRDRDAVGAASVDYIMFSGYVLLGVVWAASARAAYRRLEQGTTEEAFYRAKIQTAEFYFAKILPRTTSLLETMSTGPDSLMKMDEAEFIF